MRDDLSADLERSANGISPKDEAPLGPLPATLNFLGSERILWALLILDDLASASPTLAERDLRG